MPRAARARRHPAAAVWLVAVACAGALAASGCQLQPERVEVVADTAAGETPFRLVGPGEAALVVPVHLNGRGPYDFILDTGATLTCVTRSVADTLDLRESRVPAVGVGVGGAGRVQLAQVDSLRLGGTLALDVPVCLLDLSQTSILGTEIEGLLGLNVLKEFRVTIDFERGVVRLEP